MVQVMFLPKINLLWFRTRLISFFMMSALCWYVSMGSAQFLEAVQSPAKRATNFTQDKLALIVITFPAQGWYLVSLPLTVADSSVSTLFPTALGAFGWENNRYVRATTMRTGRGYWLLIPAPTTAVISGARLTQFRAHYLPGWHLIGSVMDTVNFANPNDTPDRSVIVPIFAWDAGGSVIIISSR